ncbi:MAG: hypothetical protein Q4B61_05885 [Bacteroidales bacterium]|nr:hypothetical protein [Bacteroidales bacterium]
MLFWGNIFSYAKDEALENLERAIKDYKYYGNRANDCILYLYRVRKDALVAIENAEDILKKRSDFGIDNINNIAGARASIRYFTNTVQISQKNSDFSDRAAFITAFGKKAIVDASATLSGVSDVQDNMDFQEDNSITTIGTTVGAATILALAGPVGFIVGGAGALGFGLASFFKNKEIEDKAQKMKDEIENKTEKVKFLIEEVDLQIERIRQDIVELNSCLNINDYPRIVEIINSLCYNINYKFKI